MLMDKPTPAQVIAPTITFLVLDAIAIALRVYNRIRSKQRLQADDWLILQAFILVIGLCATLLTGVSLKALAYPATGTNWEQFEMTRKLEYITLIISSAALGLIKTSVLLFYRRIFVTDKYNYSNGRNLFFLCMIATMALWGAGFTFAFTLMCKWNFRAAFGEWSLFAKDCIDTQSLYYGFIWSDFLSDALTIIIPIPFIWRLHLTVGKKVAVTAIFLLGILATITSLTRVVYTAILENGSSGEYSDDIDFKLLITTKIFWYDMEALIGLLAACLPTLAGLIRRVTMQSMVQGIRSRLFLGSRFTNSERVLEL